LTRLGIDPEHLGAQVLMQHELSVEKALAEAEQR
jgi:hypothetical protein